MVVSITYQGQKLSAECTGMLERERDEVDVGADSISRQCRLLISKYREEILGLKLGGEAEQHFSLVADGLDSYLKSVVSVHSEMRAVRVARQIRQKKLSRYLAFWRIGSL